MKLLENVDDGVNEGPERWGTTKPMTTIASKIKQKYDKDKQADILNLVLNQGISKQNTVQ